jgi:LPS-assembly lipoprotein
MSSSDHASRARRRFGARGPVLTLAAALLGACSVQPLYGPSNFVEAGPLAADLTRIAVAPVDDRVAQQVRNRVIFQMTGGKAIVDPLYRMTLSVTSRQFGTGITAIEASQVYTVDVGATFKVTRIDTGAVVVEGTARGSASYNRVNQIFANTRAKIDAENRAAEQAGNLIAVRVAAAFAKGPPPAPVAGPAAAPVVAAAGS